MAAGKIFINYRREDSRADAGRLYDRLHDRYPSRIFRDVGSLEPGIEWRDAIDRVLANSDACIVVIGKSWLNVTDASGKRRLDDARDTVRQELQTALKSGMRVFPVLVGGAKMPAEEELPEELQALTRRNALEITEQDWNEDFEKLVGAVERALGWSPAKRPARSRTALVAAGGVVATVLVLALVAALVPRAAEKKADTPAVVATNHPPPADSAPSVTDTKSPPPNRPNPVKTLPERPARVDDVKDVKDVKNAAPRASVAPVAPIAPVGSLEPPAPHRPSMVEKAREALAAGRLVEPRDDNALYWTQQAEQINEPGAAEMAQRTNTAILNQLQALAKVRRFEEELALVNAYGEFYPANAAMQRSLQQIRDQIRQAQAGDPVRIHVIHRHGVNYRTARCEGWLTIEPNGSVTYECDPRFPHDGRCDRVRFASGTFTYNTSLDPEQLHFSTSSGNFDFFAQQPTIAMATRALLQVTARNLR